MKVLIIDNYDSFTFNLYQYVGEILSHSSSGMTTTGFEVIVKRNDELNLAQVTALNADRIIISPGPGTPEDPDYFGVCQQVILELGKTIPLLGICLGMQGIAHAFGGDIVRAKLPMHGKTSDIKHDEKRLYAGLPQPLEVMRYHSLVVNPKTVPDCFEITAVVTNEVATSHPKKQELMGIRHKQYPIEGVQFHPESFASEAGLLMLRNFLLKT